MTGTTLPMESWKLLPGVDLFYSLAERPVRYTPINPSRLHHAVVPLTASILTCMKMRSGLPYVEPASVPLRSRLIHSNCETRV
jgi:hypothetical protein